MQSRRAIVLIVLLVATFSGCVLSAPMNGSWFPVWYPGFGVPPTGDYRIIPVAMFPLSNVGMPVINETGTTPTTVTMATTKPPSDSDNVATWISRLLSARNSSSTGNSSIWDTEMVIKDGPATTSTEKAPSNGTVTEASGKAPPVKIYGYLWIPMAPTGKPHMDGTGKSPMDVTGMPPTGGTRMEPSGATGMTSFGNPEISSSPLSQLDSVWYECNELSHTHCHESREDFAECDRMSIQTRPAREELGRICKHVKKAMKDNRKRGTPLDIPYLINAMKEGMQRFHQRVPVRYY